MACSRSLLAGCAAAAASDSVCIVCNLYSRAGCKWWFGSHKGGGGKGTWQLIRTTGKKKKKKQTEIDRAGVWRRRRRSRAGVSFKTSKQPWTGGRLCPVSRGSLWFGRSMFVSERRTKTTTGCFRRSTTIRPSHSSNQLPVHWGQNLSKFQADDSAALAGVRCNYFSGSWLDPSNCVSASSSDKDLDGEEV